jgi:DNA polymerase III epsilon subunit-like protein
MIVLDVETTGLEPKVHSIVSIGAVDTNRVANNLDEPMFYGECIVWPGAKIDDEALGVNGFTRSQVEHTNDEIHENLIKKYVYWLRQCENLTIAGENVARFDCPFLESALARTGYDEKFIHEHIGIRTVEIHSISYIHHRKKGHEIPMKNKRSALSLDETLKYVGLPPEEKPHNGLIGAILEAEAIWRFTYGKSLFIGTDIRKLIPHAFPEDLVKNIPNFRKYEIPVYLKDNN